MIAWLILGALSGWIASRIMKRDEQMGAIANIVVGIIGAFIGGFLGTRLLGVDVTGLNITSILLSVLGAVILLAILGGIRK
ncbi:MAG: GlsB/YeaQ/YmgE family stress response membrane protein [Peptoniphilus sp.]|uniref:GlsB/YeaQ/YmgE family stress response membrane protein n=1 Tax=Peptoniphilus sp. TaxID=1971214 RepID=UPI002A7661F9|nr:GlsB/YeaQ/YmgE family stress response membrane protein [Peptoniphilus sp.]MDY2986025.1 GlsB/YeaQ/YmgE family stress response membrane protein [Peptoniphilus sp.]